VIPKIIHFIWIPGFADAPEYSSVNIDLWIQLNPEYEIMIWEESDIVKILSKEKLHIFNKLSNIKKADFARLEIIIKFGGCYFDCDLEPHKPLSYFFAKKKLHRPKIINNFDSNDKVLKFEKAVVNVSEKTLILSREWKNPDLRLNFFTPRDRSANGIIISIKNNPILYRFLELNHKNIKKRVLHYLGPHALTMFLQRNSNRFKQSDLSIIPPQHFLWEDKVGKMPRWSISKHMGTNTWGDHTKQDFWNVA
jgi:hypothetical protein